MTGRWLIRLLLVIAACAAAAAGFQTRHASLRQAGQAIADSQSRLSGQYELRLAAGQFTAPVGVAASPGGDLYVAESGRQTGTEPRVIRIRRGTDRATLAADFPAPLTGITWHEERLYVAHAGGVDVLDPKTGLHHPILTGLPAGGDHPNGPVVAGPDGWLYFGIGSATNAGVVGPDNISRGWVQQHPQTRDIPCQPVTLRGINYSSPNPFTDDPRDNTATGGFSPFGQSTARLERMEGSLPCTGAVFRVRPDGTGLELVAWGLRDPSPLAFAPDGQLYAAVAGMQDRGSRPIVGDADYLYRIQPGGWYGWPDFAGGRSVTAEAFHSRSGPATPLLAEPPQQPPAPVAVFPPGSGVRSLLFPPDSFGLRGEGLVALFDEAGHSQGSREPDLLLRVNPRTGTHGTLRFAIAAPTQPKGGPGKVPAGPSHPVHLALAPDGSLLLVDLGEIRPGSAAPVPGTGAVWRLVRLPVR